MTKSFLLFLLSTLFISTFAYAKKDNLSVFYDCNNFGGPCYYDYIRQENTLITFVRDRTDADVHVMLKSNKNSIGVDIVTYFVVGRNEYAYMQDTINFSIPLNSTDDDKRKLLVHQLQISLLPYLAKTTIADKLDLSFKNKNTNDTNKLSTAKEKDKYNAWVFQIGGNGNISGSKNYRDIYANGYVFADRETDKTKQIIGLQLMNNLAAMKIMGKP